MSHSTHSLEEAYFSLQWIMDNAKDGFYLFTAPASQQCQIAKQYANESVRLIDYSEERQPFSYEKLMKMLGDTRDISTVFLINMQVALKEEVDFRSLNSVRDLMARQEIIWVLVMLPQTDNKLAKLAPDLYSIIRLKTYFPAEPDSAPSQDSAVKNQYMHAPTSRKPSVEATIYQDLEQSILESIEEYTDVQTLSALETLKNGAEIYRKEWNLQKALETYQVIREQQERILGKDDPDLAETYFTIGDIWLNLYGLDNAEEAYHSALDIDTRQKNEHGMARACHQLGIVAQKRQDFDEAEKWYEKSLEMALQQNNDYGAALTYHQLGMVAEERQDFETAEAWYKKSHEIKLQQNNDYGAASTYHQLGVVAQERRDFDAAEGWYEKSLEIALRQNDEYRAAQTYHQLGMLFEERRGIDTVEERRNFDKAEAWYKKSLEIKLRQNDEYGLAQTYHQLGILAEERRDFDAAKAWYEISLDIELLQNDEYGAASTYHQLGRVAEERQDFDAAASWYEKALEVFERFGDAHNADIAKGSLGRLEEKRVQE
jgi:tetratricopeptide (TPR) repeat protein